LCRTTRHGIGVPKKTPTEIVDKLNKEINAALADPKIKARLAALGVTILQGSPADFGKLIASFNEGFYKVALIRVFEARLHRATS
jgi:tripartite-type tricarboxylate transporter receptor subunit TctC